MDERQNKAKGFFTSGRKAATEKSQPKNLLDIILPPDLQKKLLQQEQRRAKKYFKQHYQERPLLLTDMRTLQVGDWLYVEFLPSIYIQPQWCIVRTINHQERSMTIFHPDDDTEYSYHTIKDGRVTVDMTREDMLRYTQQHIYGWTRHIPHAMIQESAERKAHAKTDNGNLP